MLLRHPADAVPRVLRRGDHDVELTGSGVLRRPAQVVGRGPLADQNTAGSIAWSFGELPTVLLLAVGFFSWARSEERRGRTLDRAAQRTADAEREAYNARLRALARSDG